VNRVTPGCDLCHLKVSSLIRMRSQLLRNCKPGDCLIRMPASAIQKLQKSGDWSAANADEKSQRTIATKKCSNFFRLINMLTMKYWEFTRRHVIGSTWPSSLSSY
jgi:hypothetical protein